MSKSARLQERRFRVNHEEGEIVDAKAAAAGLSVSDYLRKRAANLPPLKAGAPKGNKNRAKK